MAIGVNEIGGGPKDIIGCIDPQASNYNPLTTIPCGPNGQPTPDLFGTYTSGCCNYPAGNLTGCMDPQANNYNPSAIQPCASCCSYGQPAGVGELGPGKDTDVIIINPGGGTGTGSDSTTYCSDLLFSITTNGVITNGSNNIKEDCCLEQFVGQPVFWDGQKCITYTNTSTSLCDSLSSGIISKEEFQKRVTCIDCDNFGWWDNLYTTINGDSLKNIDNDLWDFLISIITSSPEGPFVSGSFYVDSLTGEPIVSENCCSQLANSNFQSTTTDLDEKVSACLCNIEQDTSIFCKCLTSVDEFISLAASIQGNQLLLNTPVLMSLGLTTQESLFVINNLFNANDFTGDGIPDNVNARILLSNALYIKGGFYVCYQTYNNGSTQNNEVTNSNISIPVQTTPQKCVSIGGYYDGVLCYCNPIDECNLSLTDLSTTTTLDNFNQNITYVTFKGGAIDETCCLKIASENNLPWVYEEYQGEFRCFTKDPNPCLPLEFKLNNELIKPICDTPLLVSTSFYFGVPENSCVEVVDEGDDEIDVEFDIEPCLLTFDSNNELVDYNSHKVLRKVDFVLNTENLLTEKEPCCFNPISPISANLAIKDNKNIILQRSDSFVFNELETWHDLSMEFDTSTVTGNTEGYNVVLQFTSGLNCCCTYDIFIDNINFNCVSAQTIFDTIKNDCIGFEIVPVIDNKKSWVYNPGLLDYSGIVDVSNNLPDNQIIESGQIGLIQGHGVINRTFAPSPDAELPWRYTDYFNQSSVLEKHSNLVLNSKELYMTFDMCSNCCLEYKPCPNGYTLSAGTDVCYKYVTVGKQFQDGEYFQFQDGQWYDFMDF